MIVNLRALERGWDAPFAVIPSLDRDPFVDGSHPSAIRPFFNTKNKYYGLPNSIPIGRAIPPIKAAQFNTINGQANTQFDFGAAATYRATDEIVRQFSIAALMQAQQRSFFQTAAR